MPRARARRYYRTQCIISAFFMLLADVLMLLQLVSLLSQWAYLQPSPYPYLPLVVFQCINLAAANVLQVRAWVRAPGGAGSTAVGRGGWG